MYPSSWRIRAISALSLLAGRSTRWCLAATALRMRESMSEIGSVILASSCLPGALGHTCDVAFQCQLAEAEAAHRELAHVGARTSAQPAAVTQANPVLRWLGFLGDLCSRGHSLILSWSGTASRGTAAASALPRR